MDIHAKLAELGLKLPVLGKPVAAYIPAVRSGNLLMVSGQVCMKDGKLQMAGRVPSQVSPEDAFRAAETCALNAVAAIDQGLDGDWSKFRRIVRAGVYVYSDPEFGQQHIVANGASELLAKIFGEAGRHARTAIGVAALPLGAPVEVDLMVEVGRMRRESLSRRHGRMSTAEKDAELATLVNRASELMRAAGSGGGQA